ncbi:restriction endonuclease subunit S [Actinomadura sp. KC345]|uniref:restriction endonuclease subunit S n=1 Tax=Actinomadura sp. KC345 TaxID=2530371 RepID=UPI001049F756|nr:restriction endonuclease subunit S [Actinomadura sp. KC345]TDC58293.1 restriction endonuclease subunit S [Actinomadura sp. KC345]
MTAQPVRLGDELQLERFPVAVSTDTEYTQIGIRSFGRGIFHRDKMPGNELSKLRYFEVTPERLIVSNIMAWEGAIAVSTDRDRDCIASNRFLSYAPSTNVDVRYLNYYFQSAPGMRAIRGTSTGTVLRNQTLSIKDFENLVVPLPDVKEQRRIAARLDAALAKLAHVKGLREHRARLCAALAESMIGSAIESPQSVGLIGDIMTLTRRPVAPEPGKTYREIGIRSFGRGVFHKEPVTSEDLGNKRVFAIRPGDLLFSNVFAWEGAVALASETEAGFIGSHRFMTYQVNENRADSSYLRHYFTCKPGLETIRRTSPGSAGRNKTLGIKNFEAQPIPLPSLSEQHKVGRILDAISKGISANDSAEIVAAFKPSLLNKAFSGQL